MKSLIAALIFTFALSVSGYSMTNYQSPDKTNQTVSKVDDKSNKTTKKARTSKKCDVKGCCSKDGKMSKDCKMDKNGKMDKDCKMNKKEETKK